MPVKLRRCAAPPMTLCSTVQQPRKPKSCRREGSRGEAAPASALSSKAASMTSRALLLSVATVVGYLRNSWYHAERSFSMQGFLESRGEAAPASTLSSKAASMTSRALLLSMATVVGYLRNQPLTPLGALLHHAGVPVEQSLLDRCTHQGRSRDALMAVVSADEQKRVTSQGPTTS